MKARWLVGKTIASIKQERVHVNGGIEYDLQVLRFSDGTKLVLGAFETEYDGRVGAQFLDRDGKVRK